METLTIKIEELATEASSLIDDIKNAESQVKIMKDSLRDIQQTQLPELIDNEGYAIGSVFVLKSGKTLTVKELFSSSIPSQTAINKCKDPAELEELRSRRQLCFDWLEANGLEDIIKNDVKIKFARDEKELVAEFELYAQSKGFAYSKEEKVHPGTLNSAMKEIFREGKSIPEQFSFYAGAVADIK